jgi:hypothetical protein
MDIQETDQNNRHSTIGHSTACATNPGAARTAAQEVIAPQATELPALAASRPALRQIDKQNFQPQGRAPMHRHTCHACIRMQGSHARSLHTSEHTRKAALCMHTRAHKRKAEVMRLQQGVRAACRACMGSSRMPEHA